MMEWRYVTNDRSMNWDTANAHCSGWLMLVGADGHCLLDKLTSVVIVRYVGLLVIRRLIDEYYFYRPKYGFNIINLSDTGAC